MPINSWVQLLNNTSADGTALTNTVTETSILNASLDRYTLAANLNDTVGKKYLGIVGGRISTLVTAPGTMTLRLKLGAVAAFTSGALPLNIVAKVNVPWWMLFLLEIRTVGATATSFGMGSFESEALIGSPLPTVGGSGMVMLPFNAAPAVGASFDSGASQLVDVTAQWSVANAANSIQKHVFAFLPLN